jgi:hypothetical protein
LKFGKWSASRAIVVISALLVIVNLAGAQTQSEEITRLKEQLAAQQKRLEMLQPMMQQFVGKAVSGPAKPGAVASLTPVIPASPPAATPAVSNRCEAGYDATNAVPSYFRLGSTCIIPVGFMDLTGIWRNVNAASGIGTNFAIVPFKTLRRGTTPSSA